MADAGIPGELDDKVRQLVDGVAGGIEGVVETAARAGSVEPEILVGGDNAGCGGVGVGAEATATDGGLRTFDGDCRGKLIVEGLGYAEGVSALPGETNDVLRINLRRECFGTQADALLVFRGQAPHLAAANGEAVVESRLRPQLALTENVRVALAVVGSCARAEKVRFVVTGQIGGTNFCAEEQAEARLASGKVHFRELAERVALVRNGVEGRVDVGAESVLTIDGSRFDETARGESDALEADARGALVLGGGFVLRAGGRGSIDDGGIAGGEIGNGGIERGSGGLDFAVVVTASVAFTLASEARALAEAAVSRASSI